MKGETRAEVRLVDQFNVAGIVPGTDPKLKDEVVIYSAHWDHLGKQGSTGDTIYNGAVDNAIRLGRPAGDGAGSVERRPGAARFLGRGKACLQRRYAASPCGRPKLPPRMRTRRTHDSHGRGGGEAMA